MPSVPRLLAIVGSGETTAAAARVHRELLSRFGSAPVAATIVDTPYGFQENAPDITVGAVDYFERRLGNPATVASFRRDSDPVARASALERIREADYVFSGPGSPGYALRHWAGTDVPRLFGQKLAAGGALVMASAAALTLGRFTVPVYEIYKVGAEPHWLAGLDLPAAWGWTVAIVPHYDNAEGRGHDTRFCFLGERRLRMLENDMPDHAFILGVDEHTTLVLDLERREATIRGRGGVTVRRRGESTLFPAGAQLSFDDIERAAFGGGTSSRRDVRPGASAVDRGAPDRPRDFDDAIAAGDVHRAIDAIMTVAATEPAPDSGVLASMIVRLATAADALTDRAGLVTPLIDALVAARASARSRGDWAAADEVRDTLLALGVELHDAPDGTAWSLAARQPTEAR
jgi:cyanophycinase-like exopeptidase